MSPGNGLAGRGRVLARSVGAADSTKKVSHDSFLITNKKAINPKNLEQYLQQLRISLSSSCSYCPT